MEPTESELAGLATCGPLIEWCGMTAEGRRRFMDAFGLDAESHVRGIARMSYEDFDAVAATIKVNIARADQEENLVPPQPLLRSQFGLFWETARLVCGVTKLAVVAVKESEQKQEQANKHAIELAKASASAGPPGPSGPKASRMVAAETVTDQSDRKTEFPVLDSAQLAQLYAN